MKILVAGDFCQRYRTDKAIKNREYGVLFDSIKPIVESADFSIVNFEFPIVPVGVQPKPIPKCGPNLLGTIEAIDAIKYAGFKCCTLANNHILDQGEECCIATKTLLEEAGLFTVGAGTNLSEAKEVLYKKIGIESIAIINCCEHEFSIATDSTAGANPLNPIQQYYTIREAHEKADYVLVIVHGGHEHYQLPSTRMQEIYRFFIEAGADAVVNGHQHCYSGYEEYKGKVIIYGLGNLCFDSPQKVNDPWNEGYMAMLEFESGKVKINQLLPYVQCNENIGVYLLDKKEFNNRINEINEIIKSSQRLKDAEDNYYALFSNHILNLYQPYENRFLKRLFKKGLLPSLVSKKRLLAIWNFIECEAHRDKQLFAFKKLVK